MENVATYSEARSEFTKQLAVFIVSPIVTWFQNLWARNAHDKQRCIVAFQTECEEIARWNQDRIHDEVRVLLERSGCDYMEELMTAVFIAHAKVLTAVRLTTTIRPQKLGLTIPKLDHFIHRVFRECARDLWKAAFLFISGPVNVVEQKKNLLQIEALVTEAIAKAVRGLLPVKQILQDCLDSPDTTDAVEEPMGGGSGSEEVMVPPPPPVVVPIQQSQSQPSPDVAPIPQPQPQPQSQPSPVVEAVSPRSILKQPSPEEVRIETEPTVHFSDFVSEFDETKGEPQIRYNPKLSAEEMPYNPEENEDMDNGDEEENQEMLQVDETSAKPLAMDGIEELDAPPAPPKKAPVVPVEMEVLE